MPFNGLTATGRWWTEGAVFSIGPFTKVAAAIDTADVVFYNVVHGRNHAHRVSSQPYTPFVKPRKSGGSHCVSKSTAIRVTAITVLEIL